MTNSVPVEYAAMTARLACALVLVLTPPLVAADGGDGPGDEARSHAPDLNFDGGPAREIEALGGRAVRQSTAPGAPVVAVDLSQCRTIGDADLKCLLAFEHLQTLDIRYSQVTSAGLRRLTGFKRAGLPRCQLHRKIQPRWLLWKTLTEVRP